MSEVPGAVFLSYASQDAQAALRICEALRAGGIEVWFDQSELRGGDAWDAAIRRQIKTCSLFIPVISNNTHAREEGYFRLEWKLAVDRSHLMAGTKTFLLPVVIDEIRDDERTPDKFREVQWTRLPAGETPPAFVVSVARLLSPDQFDQPVVRLPAGVMPGIAASGTRTQESAASTRRTLVLLSLAALGLIGIGYFALNELIFSKHLVGSQTSHTAGPPDATAQSAIPEKSIAVLPFVNMSSDKEQEYFSDGLTEEMIDLLGQVPELHVPARTSSFYFKGKNEDIATIAKKLRVAHVLEGSVRKADQKIRVAVQLIRASNGYQLWSKTYEGDMKDIFKVQDQIAGAVVEALKTKLASTQQVASYQTSNTEAYTQYLIGRQFARNANLDGTARAAAAYRKAIELDPHYAAAYAGLAESEARVGDMTGDRAGIARGEVDAERALTLAPDEADGYLARAYLRYAFSWDWAGAQADFEKALMLDPGNSSISGRYGQLLHGLGRVPEAIQYFRKAAELDPLSINPWMSLGLNLMDNGDFPQARTALLRALEIEPGDDNALSVLGTLQLLDGNPTEALATFRRIGLPYLQLQGIAMAEHTLGHVKESDAVLNDLVTKHSEDGAYQAAAAYAWQRDKDKAFEWLDRAYQHRDAGLSDFKTDPLLASLRGDPRYKAFLRKMNLPE